MSLEFSGILFDDQLRNVNSICINNVRKEVWVGGKDGSIRGYDLNKNVLKFRRREHNGFVVRIICWHSQRIMISFGIDGALVFWSSGAVSIDKIYLGEPIFDAVIYAKKQLVIATKSGCKFFPLDAYKLTGHFILIDRVHLINPHRDFVRSLAAQKNRLYSGGMDGTFVIYEHLLHHAGELHPAHVIRKAHAAGILCIEACSSSDEDENCFLATASYDRHVKIWTRDGQLCHVISGFEASITCLCFVNLTQQLWIASGASSVAIVDPKTGEEISKLTEIWQKMMKNYHEEKRKYLINFLFYSRELQILIAQTDAFYILHCFFNPLGCVISIPCPHPIESIAVSDNETVLIFTGDNKGDILKWEKAGFNSKKFSQEKLVMQRRLRDVPIEWQNSQEIQISNFSQRQQTTPSTQTPKKNFVEKKIDENEICEKQNSTKKILWIENLHLLIVCDERGVIYVWGYEDVETQPEEFARHFIDSARNEDKIEAVFQADKNYSHAPNSATRSTAGWSSRKFPPKKNSPKKCSPDKISPSTRCDSTPLSKAPPVSVFSESPQMKKSDFSGDHDVAATIRAATSDWKIYKDYLNRASGFFCRFILWGHDSCVSGLDYVHVHEKTEKTEEKKEEIDRHILISTAWDRRMITWNLKTGQIFDVCKRDKTESKASDEKETPDENEFVADGQITDVSFAAQRNEVAYSSRDSHLYVRKFSTQGRKMKLQKKWHAHNGEVFQVKWVEQMGGAWASSGQDATIRLWSASDLGVRLALVQCSQAVQGLTVDQNHGWILAAVENEFQIFEAKNLKLIKKHIGHQQIITGIFHVRHLYNESPSVTSNFNDESYFVTSSLDKTIKIWKADVTSKFSQEEIKSEY